MRSLLADARVGALALGARRLRRRTRPHHDHAAGAHAGERLGVVDFPNSGAPAAQQPFLRGLALLHSFEYDDARAAFRAAERADSGFAMAYWGEALTFAQLLWGLDYADSARAALAKLGPTQDARLARAGIGARAPVRRSGRGAVREDDLPRRAYADTSRACVR